MEDGTVWRVTSGQQPPPPAAAAAAARADWLDDGWRQPCRSVLCTYCTYLCRYLPVLEVQRKPAMNTCTKTLPTSWFGLHRLSALEGPTRLLFQWFPEGAQGETHVMADIKHQHELRPGTSKYGREFQCRRAAWDMGS